MKIASPRLVLLPGVYVPGHPTRWPFRWQPRTKAPTALQGMWQGRVLFLAAWKTSLTPEQIALVYNAGHGLTYQELPEELKTSLRCWFSFDEAAPK